MSADRKAVIEDLDAFFAWLATTPIIQSVAQRRNERDAYPQGKPSAAKPSEADKEFLEALKSMA
ncbi:MAG TPA: hypothetical protein VF801_06655 [Rhodocyclaceae bacterium]